MQETAEKNLQNNYLSPPSIANRIQNKSGNQVFTGSSINMNELEANGLIQESKKEGLNEKQDPFQLILANKCFQTLELMCEYDEAVSLE